MFKNSTWMWDDRLTAFLNRQISPALLSAGETTATRARILVVMDAALIASGSWAAFYQALWGTKPLAFFGLAMVAGALATLPVTRRAESLTAPASLLVGTLFLAVTAAGVATSGRGVAAVIFLVALPLVAAVLLGGRAALAWTTLVLIELVVLRWMFDNVEPLIDPLESARATAHLRGSTFVSLVILVATLLYETLTSHSLRASEKARREREASEARYRSLIEASPDGLFASRDGTVAFASRALLDILGYEDEHALVGRPVDALIRSVAPNGEDVSSRNGRLRREAVEILDASGASIPAEQTTAHFDLDGRPAEMHVLRDTRPEKEADRERTLIRSVVDESRDGIAIVDIDSRVVYVNDAYLELLRMSRKQFLGKRLLDLARNDESREMLEDVIAGIRKGEAVSFPRLDWGLVSGQRGVMDVRAFPISPASAPERRWVISVRDQTHLVQLEEQLSHTQRIDALGKLAGGIAHDFNNMLTVIMGELDFLEDDGNDWDQRHEHAEIIRDTCERSAAMTQKILAFGRKQVLRPELTDLNRVLTDLRPILRRMVPERIQLEFLLEPDLASAICDGSQIEQVLINLISNAKDAIADHGTITVRTSIPDIRARGDMMVAVSVTDDGAGIPDEHLDQIFDPFYTTKASGQGTGLGLATVHGIVFQSDGDIEVDSKLGEGTTFRVLLPALHEDASQTATPLEETTRPALIPSLRRVMVAEDHPDVRRLIAGTLRNKGIEVIEACDALEATRLLDSMKEPVDALVSDIVMPGGSGVELAHRYLAKFPDARVLLMSGYPEHETGRLASLPPSIRFIQKPMRPKLLLQALLD